MTYKTVCFTGHRKIPYNQLNSIAVRLNETVEKLILSGYCNFAAGGALGFDTMAAECVLKLKKYIPVLNWFWSCHALLRQRTGVKKILRFTKKLKIRLIKYYISLKNIPKGVCSGATAVWWITAVCAWHI